RAAARHHRDYGGPAGKQRSMTCVIRFDSYRVTSIFPHGHQGDERVQTRTPPPWTLTSLPAVLRESAVGLESLHLLVGLSLDGFPTVRSVRRAGPGERKVAVVKPGLHGLTDARPGSPARRPRGRRPSRRRSR